jgi:hypothetical protein
MSERLEFHGSGAIVNDPNEDVATNLIGCGQHKDFVFSGEEWQKDCAVKACRWTVCRQGFLENRRTKE